MMMQLKTYYKMCKHCGNDEGCDAAMDAMRDLLTTSGILPIAVVQATANDGNEIFLACVVLVGVRTSTCMPACAMRMSEERYDCLTNVGVSHLESAIGFLEWGDDINSIF